MGACASSPAALPKAAAHTAEPPPPASSASYSAPTAIHGACAAGDAARLIGALGGLTVEACQAQALQTDSNNDTALAIAVRAGHEDCVRALLGHLADPSRGPLDGPSAAELAVATAARPGTLDTPLHLCARAAAKVPVDVCVRMVGLIVAAGGALGEKNAFGSTPRSLVPSSCASGDRGALDDALFDKFGDIQVQRAG